MAPLLGGDLTQRVFLNRFAQLASDGLFHVRKILASNFGEFCAVVGQEITETVLVSWNLSFCSPPPPQLGFTIVSTPSPEPAPMDPASRWMAGS